MFVIRNIPPPDEVSTRLSCDGLCRFGAKSIFSNDEMSGPPMGSQRRQTPCQTTQLSAAPVPLHEFELVFEGNG